LFLKNLFDERVRGFFLGDKRSKNPDCEWIGPDASK
jgi:hypothetical protein